MTPPPLPVIMKDPGAIAHRILHDHGEIAFAEVFGTVTGGLLPAEEEALGRVAPVRRSEFTAGRVCAHRALAALGVPVTPVLPGAVSRADDDAGGRAPIWPDGVVGSITHCAGYAAAAVAHRTATVSLGIDAEPNQPLPGRTAARITLPAERAWLRRAPATDVCWDRLVFSAKESVYKAWWPLTGRWLGYSDVLVTVDPAAGRFTAAGPFATWPGRFSVHRGLIVTIVAVTEWEASP